MTDIYGHVSTGYIGCEKKFFICSKEEWEGMTSKEQDTLFEDCMFNEIDSWHSEEE